MATEVKRKRSFGQVTGATGSAAAFTTIVFYLIKTLCGIEVPGEVQGAFTTLVILIAGWAVPPKDDTEPLSLDDYHDDDSPRRARG